MAQPFILTLSCQERPGIVHAELAAVVSSHEDLRPMAGAVGLPFVHVPVTPVTKPEAESAPLRAQDRRLPLSCG